MAAQSSTIEAQELNVVPRGERHGEPREEPGYVNCGSCQDGGGPMHKNSTKSAHKLILWPAGSTHGLL